MKRIIRSALAVLFFLFIFGTQSVLASDKVVVVIDPGHGGYSEDASAYGAVYKDELCEKDVNLETAFALRDELQRYNNVEVYLTREDDRRLSLEERVDFALSVGADVLVSCHYNASETHLFYGSEIFTSAFGYCYSYGNGLAQCIMEQWIDDGQASKGIKTRIGSTGEDYYGIIRHGCEVSLPVIIIEHGYLDNHVDYERLGTAGDWDRMGRLDATGIANYYGLSKEQVYDEVFPVVDVPIPDYVVEPDTSPPGYVYLRIIDQNIETSEVVYELSAKESNGKLMYYGLCLGEPEETAPEDYGDLMLWEEGKSVITGTYSVPTGYRGKITARVYNNYELYSDSAPQELDFATLLEERAQLLEEAAKEAAAKAEERRQSLLKRDEEAKLEAERKKEREEVGDFFFFVGGDKKGDQVDPVKARRSLYLEIVALVVLIAVLVCIIIIKHRKEIMKTIRNIEGNDWDRY